MHGAISGSGAASVTQATSPKLGPVVIPASSRGHLRGNVKGAVRVEQAPKVGCEAGSDAGGSACDLVGAGLSVEVVVVSCASRISRSVSGNDVRSLVPDGMRTRGCGGALTAFSALRVLVFLGVHSACRGLGYAVVSNVVEVPSSSGPSAPGVLSAGVAVSSRATATPPAVAREATGGRACPSGSGSARSPAALSSGSLAALRQASTMLVQACQNASHESALLPAGLVGLLTVTVTKAVSA